MFWFLTSLAVLAVALGFGLWWFGTRKVDRNDRYSRPFSQYLPGWVPLGIFMLAVLIFLPSILTQVPARSVGVVLSYGKPVDTYGSGLHTKAPWENTKELDGTIQTNARTGSDKNPTGDDGASCTDIKIGNGSVACVDNSVVWRIKLEAGTRLYQDYPDGMDQITKRLVQRQLTRSLTEVLGTYDPLAQVKDADVRTSIAPDLASLGDKVRDSLIKAVGDDIEIRDVIIPIIRLDGNTQRKIDAYQSAVAETRIAEQSEKTSEAQARANQKITQSVEDKPEVLQSRCIDALTEMVKTKQQVPIGFSCFGNTNAPTLVTPVK